MKVFRMFRENDTSKVSGTGYVLTGIVFNDGQVVVKWHSITSSIGVWNSYDDFFAVHVASHPENKTRMEFVEISEGDFLTILDALPH